MDIDIFKIPSSGKCEKPQEVNIDYVKEIEKETVVTQEADLSDDVFNI